MNKNEYCFDYSFKKYDMTQGEQGDADCNSSSQIDEKIARFVLPILVDASTEYKKFGKEFQKEYIVPVSYRINQIENFLQSV